MLVNMTTVTEYYYIYYCPFIVKCKVINTELLEPFRSENSELSSDVISNVASSCSPRASLVLLLLFTSHAAGNTDFQRVLHHCYLFSFKLFCLSSFAISLFKLAKVTLN